MERSSASSNRCRRARSSTNSSVTTWIFQDKASGAEERHTFPLRVYSPAELVELLGSVGFGDFRAELERLAGALPGNRVLFTGPLEHRHLVHLLPLADVTVVPSIFPEAFGMVAAEAAAAGSPPLVARHSGLAEVAAGLETEYPERFRHLASFETEDPNDLARKLKELLALSPADRDELRRAGRKAVVDRWSWASVAQRLLA